MQAPGAYAAAIVLAGGRSSRMGSPKAELDWHGSTMLRRVTGLAARAVDGPVVVVGAPGQALPPLPARIEVAVDAREGRGPLQGLAAGLTAVGGRARAAYVSAIDVPLLHPAFIARVTAALSDAFDAAVPDVGGHRQPLAAAYRPSLGGLVEALVAADRVGSRSLFERCRVRFLSERELLADAALAHADPGLASVTNLNDPAAYERALALPAPPVKVGLPDGRTVTERAWSLEALAARAGTTLREGALVTLNGEPVAADPELPLVAGDSVLLAASGGS